MAIVELVSGPVVARDRQGAAILSDPATRHALTPAAINALVRLAEQWRLSSNDSCALLGGISERTWFRMKKGDWPGPLSQDELTRASALIGIYKALHLVFSDPLADEWATLPNTGELFAGRSPVAMMAADGIPAILDVRRHLDALRGGV